MGSAGPRMNASRLAATLAAVLGLTLTLALFLAARRAEWTAFQAEFARNTSAEAMQVERRLTSIGFAVQAMQQIISARNGVDAATFDTFARPFLNERRDLIAIEWLPLVPGDRRDSWEAEVRRRQPDFRIAQRAPDGTLEPASPRAEYLPIQYVASLSSDLSPVIGFDFGSDPFRRALCAQATDSGSFQVSPPTDMIALRGRGFFTIAPVFGAGTNAETAEERRHALKGFVVGVYDAHRLLAEIIAQDAFRSLPPSALSYFAEDREQTIFHLPSEGTRQSPWPRWMLPEIPDQVTAVQFGGVRWNIRVAMTDDYLDRNLPLFHWLVLPIGAVLTALLSAFAWAVTRNRLHLEQIVEERTRDLVISHDTMARIIDALDLAADGILIVAPDNHLTYANHSWTQTIGADSQMELVGRTADELLCEATGILTPQQLADLREQVRRTGSWQGQLTVPHDDPAQRRFLLAHIRGLSDGGRVVVVNDITDARRREDERHRLERQLEEARKLEALGTLAAGIAHDFNNLLGAILGFAQFIVDDTKDGEPLHRYGSRIVKAGQQAKCLIGQILTFSRRRELPMEQVDLGLMIRDNLSILKAIIAPTTALEISAEIGGAPVPAQPGEMVQVLVNLVINANESLEGRPGQVRVTLSDHDPADEDFRRLSSARGASETPEMVHWQEEGGHHCTLLGSLHDESRYRVLSVSDNGCGMSPETVAQIFTPFFTTKGKKGGSGLGLAVVRNLVMQHQGGLLVRSALGQGTTFSVFLPVSSHDAPVEISPPPPAATPHQGSILLVENSAHFGDMLTTALFRLGYEISISADSREALDFIDEDPEAWDLVISDQVMDGMSGTELVTAIKSRHPDLPCIICTAYPDALTEGAARQAGADGFVTKPLDLGHFSLMVKELVARRRP